MKESPVLPQIPDYARRNPAAGFWCSTSADGHPALHYRTTGMRRLAFCLGFAVVGLVGTLTVLFVMGDAGRLPLPVLLAIFLTLLIVVAATLWFFRSITTYTFMPDRLVIEQQLWSYCRRREVLRDEIRAVVQEKDGGHRDYQDRELTIPSCCLRLQLSEESVKILSRQPQEKSHWLGLVIAGWAAVEFVPTFEDV